MERPRVEYAVSGGYHLAYQVVGSGPVDLVYVPGWVSQLDLYWDERSVARFFRRLASFSRLILFEPRGIGLSDPVSAADVPTLEERVDDLLAVLGAVGSERVAIFGQGYGTPLTIVFAASHPERTTHLILYSPVAKAGLRTDDYPWGSTAEELQEWSARGEGEWGTDEFAAAWVRRLAPSAAADAGFVEWAARVIRASASPATAQAFTTMNALMDVRQILPLVRVPTLVVERSDAWLPKGPVDVPPMEEAEWIAERISGARVVKVPGRDYLPWVGDQESLIAEVAAFVTGASPPPLSERVLLTVLFTDIVGSTELAATIGDARWRELLEHHNISSGALLVQHRGEEIDRAGDGVLATFDGPARAVRCARAILDAAASAGLTLRAGVHSGEVERLDGRIGGIAVHVGARVAATATPGQVLVTSTVRDLVAGSGLEFADQGTHTLKGVPDDWRLFAVVGDGRIWRRLTLPGLKLPANPASERRPRPPTPERGSEPGTPAGRTSCTSPGSSAGRVGREWTRVPAVECPFCVRGQGWTPPPPVGWAHGAHSVAVLRQASVRVWMPTVPVQMTVSAPPQ